MGLEKIIGFLNKSLSYNGIKELSVENCCNKIIAEQIFFDFNFIIYINLVELEDDINNLIKILYSLPYTNIEIINNEIDKIINLNYLSLFKNDLLKILEGDNQKEILNNLSNFLYSKEKFKEYEKNLYGKEYFTDNNILDLILFNKVYYYIITMLDNIHYTEFIKNVFIFFDGIPSYSKILEQKRRRTKNFLESKIRKDLFNKTFNNFKNNIYKDKNIIYNYFDWLNNKVSLDKSFGPCSKIIIDLELFLKLSNTIDLTPNKINYSINICSGKINGESDFKIFKYIQKKNITGDIFIHTCDSDFVHLVLVQQINNIINQKKTNYNIIRYFSRKKSSVQYINSLYIIKELVKIIKKYTLTDDNKHNFLLDFLGLCYLFGNDHIKSNNWFGSELSFEEIIFLLKDSYKDRGYLITYDNRKKILINWNIFLDFLKNIQKKNISLKINLLRNHKQNNNLYTFLFKTDISYDKFKNKYIPEYFSYCGFLKQSKKDITDIELDEKYYWDIYFYNKLKIETNPFENKINANKINIFNNILNKWLTFYKTEDDLNYLQYTERIYEMEENNYQNLYQYISNLSKNIGSEKYSIYFNNNNIVENIKDNNNITENYLLIFYYLIKNFFIDMTEYNPHNLIYYKYNTSPTLDMLINYLNQINLNELSEKFNKIINDNYVDPKDYFNSLSHHLFITPYLLNSFYKEKIKDIKNIDLILEKLNTIDNLCIDDSNYNYNFKLIKPQIFLDKWKEIELL